jgi:hypothetical protein
MQTYRHSYKPVPNWKGYGQGVHLPATRQPSRQDMAPHITTRGKLGLRYKSHIKIVQPH